MSMFGRIGPTIFVHPEVEAQNAFARVMKINLDPNMKLSTIIFAVEVDEGGKPITRHKDPAELLSLRLGSTNDRYEVEWVTVHTITETYSSNIEWYPEGILKLS